MAGDIRRPTALPAHGPGPGRRPAEQPDCHAIRRADGGPVILPSGGRAFTVNGRMIRMTGGAWIPDYLMSWSAQRYRDEIRLMAEGNHTVVRVNGCGIVPPDVFFDACDRYGLLVWQDLSRTSSLPAIMQSQAVRCGVVSGQHEGLHLPLARTAEPAGLVRLATRRPRRPTSAGRCKTRFFPPWTARGRGCQAPTSSRPGRRNDGRYRAAARIGSPPAGILPPLCERPAVRRQE